MEDTLSDERPDQPIRLHVRLFELHRDDDHTGVSGTGVVAQGVEFANGVCTIQWLRHGQSTVVHRSIKAVKKIHGHGGKTRIVFLDGTEHTG